MAQLETSAAFPLPQEPSAAEKAAFATSRKYRNVRPGTSNMEAVADFLIPKEPWEYGMVAAAPGMGLIGQALAKLPRAAKLAALGLGIGTTSTEAEAAKVPSLKQMRELLQRLGIDDAQRIFKPGVYKRPDVIAREASENVAPEHPAMKELFGVTREDLYEIGERGTRKGNIEPSYTQAGKPKGSYVSDALMNPINAQRQIDTLTEAQKYPQLVHGMQSWYVMDPAFQRLEQLVGREEAVKRYNQFNTVVPMFSPASPVTSELNRGTAANMMINRGEWDQFVRHGGTAVKDRGADFPDIMRDVVPHPYQSTAHTGPVGRYIETGDPTTAMKSVKVPLYMQASGVPQTGFQTRLPVPDAHWGRSVGVGDVRTTANPGVSLKGPEYGELGPWYRESVAKPMGIEAVPAQGFQWGVYAPQTGVDTAIGAPKLELLSQMVWERAKKLGLDPAKMRDDVLLGKEHALWALGIPGAGSFAAGAYQPQGVQSQ